MQYEKIFVDSNVLLSPNFDFSKYKKIYKDKSNEDEEII